MLFDYNIDAQSHHSLFNHVLNSFAGAATAQGQRDTGKGVNANRLMRKFLFIVLLVPLCSCDPGFAVSLYNNSAESKDIKIVEHDRTHLNTIDSVLILDESKPGSRSGWQAVTAKNLTEMSYSFLLQPGKTAVLRQGIGKPKTDLSDILDKIIINNSDTIVVNKDKRVKTDKHFMSMKVVISVE